MKSTKLLEFVHASLEQILSIDEDYVWYLNNVANRHSHLDKPSRSERRKMKGKERRDKRKRDAGGI